MKEDTANRMQNDFDGVQKRGKKLFGKNRGKLSFQTCKSPENIVFSRLSVWKETVVLIQCNLL